jgi:ubiquinone/menaquinone biosynthesis C-methylase UbiE
MFVLIQFVGARAGFGSGTIFDSLLEKGKQIYGLDIGNDFVRFAHDKFRNSVSLIRSDVGNIPFRDDAMDCVICSEVLEHVQEPANVIKEFQSSQIFRGGPPYHA